MCGWRVIAFSRERVWTGGYVVGRNLIESEGKSNIIKYKHMEAIHIDFEGVASSLNKPSR